VLSKLPPIYAQHTNYRPCRLWTSFILPVEKVLDSFQDEFLELKAHSCARDLFNEKSITEFWPLMCDSYPNVAKKITQGILPFVSTYLCESGFSTLLQMKTKQRNRLDVQIDMRCALSNNFPRIHELSKNKQSQVSHCLLNSHHEYNKFLFCFELFISF